jgi:hypothetical protein
MTLADVDKKPSWAMLVITCWVGFMCATAVAALIPSMRLWAAPILCHGAYGHGVVEVHNFSYGFTTGYSLDLRCANAAHQEHGTSGVAVIGILWVECWIGAILLRGVYYWGKFLVRMGWSAIGARRPAPHPVPRSKALKTATPQSLLAKARAPKFPEVQTNPNAKALMEHQQAVGVRVASATGRDPVDQLARLADLHERGALTDAEFELEKSKIISGG